MLADRTQNISTAASRKPLAAIRVFNNTFLKVQPTQLYESLFILHKCNTTINRLWSIIEKSQNRINEIEDFALLFTNYIKMESVSFLAEFNGSFYHNIEEEYKSRMKDVRIITAPIIKRISKWKDLEKFRNNIIAHPWRDKGKFAIPDRQFYNIPRNWFETGVLVNLINYTWALIKGEFSEELEYAFAYIATLKPPDKEPTDYSKLNSDHLQMAEEVETICKRLNKPYYLKVMQYVLSRNGGDNEP